MERYETVIIGGGQAGLSVGYHLQKRNRSFVILDASERIGDSWRQRWDSLKLYSPAFRDGLPGMRFPAGRAAYPTKDEFADYLGAYAAGFELPVRSGVSVDALTKEDGKYVVHTGESRLEADNVVVATGVFKKPYTPDFAGELDPSITQLHSNDYRNLSQLQKGPVLVVGASHSGSDIAWEAASKHDVVLAGKDTGQIPAPIESRRGRLGFRLLFFAGTHILTADTPMGRKMRPHIRHGGAPLLRYRRKDLERAGVERVLERVVGVEAGLPVLEEGRVLDVRNVVWCTGFRSDFGWIRFPYEIGDDGYPVQYRGALASSPGLYFAGLPFLHSFASMLVGGAPAAHALGRERARRLVTEAVLVWNGLVSESPALRDAELRLASAAMAARRQMFHVVLTRAGPEYDLSKPLEEQSKWREHADFMDGLVDEGFIVLGGPLADEYRNVHVVHAESEQEVRDTFARDPWSGSHLEVDSVDAWTIRLDRRPQ